MLDSMPEYITRYRPEGARDFMVAAANYEVQDQNGIYGEDFFMNRIFFTSCHYLPLNTNTVVPGDAIEPVAAPVAPVQPVHSNSRNSIVQQALAKIIATDGMSF